MNAATEPKTATPQANAPQAPPARLNEEQREAARRLAIKAFFKDAIQCVYYIADDRRGGQPGVLAEHIAKELAGSFAPLTTEAAATLVQEMLWGLAVETTNRLKIIQARDALGDLQKMQGEPASDELEAMREVWNQGSLQCKAGSPAHRLVLRSKWLKLQELEAAIPLHEGRVAHPPAIEEPEALKRGAGGAATVATVQSITYSLSDLGVVYLQHLHFIEQHADTSPEEIAAWTVRHATARQNAEGAK